MRQRKMMEVQIASIPNPGNPYDVNTERAKIPTSSPPKLIEKTVESRSANGRKGKTRRTQSTLSIFHLSPLDILTI